MKSKTQLLITLICGTLGILPLRAATNYWDSDGAMPGGSGSGAASGIWGVDDFWSAASGGDLATGPWTPGNDAVFSAGTNATGISTITLSDTQTAGNLTVEEGTLSFAGGTSLNVGGGVAGKGIIDIAAGLTTTISTVLEGGDDTGQITKIGAGTLVLSGANSYGGLTVVSNGILSVITASALGSTLTPTVVSNGATLRAASSAAIPEPVVLYGTGVGNAGALRATVSPPQANGWSGGAILGSDARINLDAAGTWTWTAKPILGTNDGNNFNLTIGGNGGSFRLNVAGGYNRSLNLGGGAIIKEGGVELRFENPVNAGALYFNGGHILSRSSASTILTINNSPSPIYVGAGAGQFRTGSAGPSYTLANSILLGAGANPVFNPDSTYTITSSGVISGLGGLIKAKPGTLILNAANTYGGNTTVRAGSLVLGVGGSLSNSPLIDVQSGATFDVSAVAGGFVLETNQTLKGNGTVLGSVTALGTIAPGASIGNLTFNNDLTLAGNLAFEVSKRVSPSNDVITVAGTLTNAGSGIVTVANLGLALAAGDSFQLFSQPVLNGQALTVLSTDGVVWTNQLAVDGSVAVVSTPALVPATNLSLVATGPNSFKVGGIGAANRAYGIFASTNVISPAADWVLIGITNSDAGGVIQFVDPQATNDQRFYRFGQ